MRRDFGAQLRKLMEQAGLSQYQVARRCGLQQGQISSWVTGRSMPTIKSLRKLEEAFPGLLFQWGPAALEHQRDIHAKALAAAHAAKREKTRVAVDAAWNGTPAAMSVGEIAARAREKGITYGDYVAKYCKGG